jgi:hypothetical protein
MIIGSEGLKENEKKRTKKVLTEYILSVIKKIFWNLENLLPANDIW